MNWIKTLLGIKPKHVHKWEPQYSTGHSESRWEYNGKVGYGRSYVQRCACGQWAVVHSGLDEYILINQK